MAGLVPASAEDLAPPQKAAICGTRTTCTLVVTDAGSDRDGQKLTVAEARFGIADKPAEALEAGCINDDPDSTDEYNGGHEFWLLEGDAAPKLLLKLCNDGYGAGGMGEDEIKIFPNGIRHFQVGGSAWRWETTKTYRLSPLAVTKELSCFYNVVGAGSGQILDIDRLTLHVRAVGYVTRDKWTDDQLDCPDWSPEPDRVLPTGPDLAGAYPIIMPREDSAPMLPEITALGDCALELSTDGLHGFMVYGKPAEPADAATLRVIEETATSYLVQVYDPTAAAATAAAAGKSWVQQPHIEIWTGEEDEPNDDQGPNIAYRQIGIDLKGQAYAGARNPTHLPKATVWQAKDEAGRPVTVMRLTWENESQPLSGLGIVYSQSAKGKQARLVSSALIKKNKPLYLPEVWRNMAEENGIKSGSCEVKDGLLQLAPQ